MAAIFDFNGSGRLGKKQICTKGAVGGGVSLFALPSPPTPTVHSNCKSNMAGRINDRELIKLARTNKTPAQQAYKIGSTSLTSQVQTAVI